jgi:signal transduction histidine kinase
MLHQFITVNREELIRRCRTKVAARSTPPPTTSEIDHGVPVFLSQLADALRLGVVTTPEIGASGIRHGEALLRHGFTLSQVVHDYGDICQAITELAVETRAPIRTEDFRTLNRCLDDAIAGAVTEHGHSRDRSTLDREAARGSDRLGFFAHELRNRVDTAIMAFEVLKTGNVGVNGSTGTVLGLQLRSLRALIGCSLAEVRLTHGVHNRERFKVSEFIDELAPAVALEARARGVGLNVLPVDDGVTIEADREILAAVVGNLLQNGFKFTRPQTTVTLRVTATDERVLVEVEDECEGLPGPTGDLFRAFEQHGTDRSGLGMGLAFCKWGVEANNGQLTARNRPDTGCVFTVNLPRVSGQPVAPS